MYRVVIERYASQNQFVHINLPADDEKIKAAEISLGVKFPSELKNLLLELNVDDWLLFSADTIATENKEVRDGLGEVYDGLDELLFIAGNGCGDYYGYKINGDSVIVENKIIMWEHETNETHQVASSIIELINRYYSDEI